MCENVYFSIKNPKAGPGPRPQIACFAHMNLLRYVCNFQSQKLGPIPLTKSWIRTWASSVGVSDGEYEVYSSV